MIEGIAGPVWTDDTIRRQTGRLYRSALGMTHNATDAEDLVQETFAKALAASGRLQPGTNLAAWLHTIMFNAFVSEYHKRRREPLLATDPADGEANLHWLWDAADCRSAEEQALGRLIEAEIVAAIRALPYSYRIMVYLADVKGLDYRQIASLTGVSIGTVKSSLHRGRHQLRIRLADTLGQEAALPVCQMTRIGPDRAEVAGRAPGDLPSSGAGHDGTYAPTRQPAGLAHSSCRQQEGGSDRDYSGIRPSRRHRTAGTSPAGTAGPDPGRAG